MIHSKTQLSFLQDWKSSLQIKFLLIKYTDYICDVLILLVSFFLLVFFEFLLDFYKLYIPINTNISFLFNKTRTVSKITKVNLSSSHKQLSPLIFHNYK